MYLKVRLGLNYFILINAYVRQLKLTISKELYFFDKEIGLFHFNIMGV